MSNVLLTGAAGHTGARLAEVILEQTDMGVISLERLPHEGSVRRTDHLPTSRFQKVYHDFSAPIGGSTLAWLKESHIRYIIHNGAEVHAIRSLTQPEIFVQSNIVGTFNMLEAARQIKPELFLYTSSAEALGPVQGNWMHGENDPLVPSNPYAATKAAGEMLVRSYVRTFGVPAIIVRTMNLFGEKQQNTKFVPMALGKILRDEVLKIHVGPDGAPGVRQWLHIDNYIDALRFLMVKGTPGQVYHVAGTRMNNVTLAYWLADYAGKPLRCEMVDVSIHHKAHDLVYLIDDQIIRKMGWMPPEDFKSTLHRTVEWFKANQEWL